MENKNAEIVAKVKRYFNIKELVSRNVYMLYGERAWVFFDVRLLEVLLWLREGLNVSFICNNWATGGEFQQRGFRENTCDIVSEKTAENKTYCSAHMRGQALDLSSKITAESMRKWVELHYSECPHPIRVEKGVTWFHFDVCNITDELIKFRG